MKDGWRRSSYSKPNFQREKERERERERERGRERERERERESIFGHSPQPHSSEIKWDLDKIMN